MSWLKSGNNNIIHLGALLIQDYIHVDSTHPHDSNMRGTQAFSAFCGPLVMRINRPTAMDAIQVLVDSTPEKGKVGAWRLVLCILGVQFVYTVQSGTYSSSTCKWTCTRTCTCTCKLSSMHRYFWRFKMIFCACSSKALALSTLALSTFIHMDSWSNRHTCTCTVKAMNLLIQLAIFQMV